MTVLSTGNIQYNTDSMYNVTSLTLHSQISSQYNNTSKVKTHPLPNHLINVVFSFRKISAVKHDNN